MVYQLKTALRFKIVYLISDLLSRGLFNEYLQLNKLCSDIFRISVNV
jgi:hypothetical protein